MLKKSQRLTRSEFSSCFKLGQKNHTPYFTVIKCPNLPLKGAVVVSKKLYKSAPARNRLRRQTYAHLANFMVIEKPTLNFSLIVIFNPKAKEIPRPQLLSLLKEKLDELR